MNFNINSNQNNNNNQGGKNMNPNDLRVQHPEWFQRSMGEKNIANVYRFDGADRNPVPGRPLPPVTPPMVDIILPATLSGPYNDPSENSSPNGEGKKSRKDINNSNILKLLKTTVPLERFGHANIFLDDVEQDEAIEYMLRPNINFIENFADLFIAVEDEINQALLDGLDEPDITDEMQERRDVAIIEALKRLNLLKVADKQDEFLRNSATANYILGDIFANRRTADGVSAQDLLYQHGLITQNEALELQRIMQKKIPLPYLSAVSLTVLDLMNEIIYGLGYKIRNYERQASRFEHLDYTVAKTMSALANAPDKVAAESMMLDIWKKANVLPSTTRWDALGRLAATAKDFMDPNKTRWMAPTEKSFNMVLNTDNNSTSDLHSPSISFNIQDRLAMKNMTDEERHNYMALKIKTQQEGRKFTYNPDEITNSMITGPNASTNMNLDYATAHKKYAENNRAFMNNKKEEAKPKLRKFTNTQLPNQMNEGEIMTDDNGISWIRQNGKWVRYNEQNNNTLQNKFNNNQGGNRNMNIFKNGQRRPMQKPKSGVILTNRTNPDSQQQNGYYSNAQQYQNNNYYGNQSQFFDNQSQINPRTVNRGVNRGGYQNAGNGYTNVGNNPQGAYQNGYTNTSGNPQAVYNNGYDMPVNNNQYIDNNGNLVITKALPNETIYDGGDGHFYVSRNNQYILYRPQDDYNEVPVNNYYANQAYQANYQPVAHKTPQQNAYNAYVANAIAGEDYPAPTRQTGYVDQYGNPVNPPQSQVFYDQYGNPVYQVPSTAQPVTNSNPEMDEYYRRWQERASMINAQMAGYDPSKNPFIKDGSNLPKQNVVPNTETSPLFATGELHLGNGNTPGVNTTVNPNSGKKTITIEGVGDMGFIRPVTSQTPKANVPQVFQHTDGNFYYIDNNGNWVLVNTRGANSNGYSQGLASY